MIIQICVGSSCHVKGSSEIVNLLQSAIETHSLSDEITLAGSFCTGLCNRVGVTLIVDDEAITGVTPMTFNDFFKEKVLAKFNK